MWRLPKESRCPPRGFENLPVFFRTCHSQRNLFFRHWQTVLALGCRFVFFPLPAPSMKQGKFMKIQETTQGSRWPDLRDHDESSKANIKNNRNHLKVIRKLQEGSTGHHGSACHDLES